MVEVHEVHVDLFIGNFLIILGSKMAPGLPEVHKAVDPHLAGGERVAPGDDPGADVVVVGRLDHVRDLLVGLCRDLVDQGIGQDPAELLRHLLGPCRHGLQHLGPVEELTAHHEPELFCLHIHRKPLLLPFLVGTAPHEAAYLRTLKDHIDATPDWERTPPDLYARRLDACKGCGFLEAGTCGACGCYVELRAASKRGRCPYKKW